MKVAVSDLERIHELIALLNSDAPGWMKEFAESQLLEIVNSLAKWESAQSPQRTRAKAVAFG